MTIELPPAQARALNELLKSGDFSTPAQVLAAGLRLLEAKEADRAKAYAEVRQEVLEGVKQVRVRRVTPFDDAAVARIKARGRKILENARR